MSKHRVIPARVYYMKENGQSNPRADRLSSFDDWLHYVVYSQGIDVPDHEIDEMRETLADGRCYLFKYHSYGGDGAWLLVPED